VRALLAISLLAGLLLPGGLELTVRPTSGGEPLLRLPLEPGERFTLRYLHSVDGTPVWEVHSADSDGTLYVEEERFELLGAGMGHWQGHGTLAYRDGRTVIEGIHAPVGDFLLRIGSAGVDHTILWRGRAFPLSRDSAGTAVVVSVRRLGLLERLWRA
jgi:hypothetical protein